MKKRETNTEFITVINDAIKSANIRKAKVADASGINRSTITRIFAGETGVSKPTAKAIVRSINTIAGKPILDERGALESAGFEAGENLQLEFELGDGARLVLDDKFSPDEQKNIVEVMQIAYEIAIRKFT